MHVFVLAVAVVLAVTSGQEVCKDDLNHVLRQIRDLITVGNMHCREQTREGVFGEHTERMVQALGTNAEVIKTLASQAETLRLALGSVAEVQAQHKAQLAALQHEVENSRAAQRQARRGIQDLQSDLTRLKTESQAWVEHVNTMESEMKAAVQKSELASQEAAIEAKNTQERVSNLGKVIRRVQKSMQVMDRTLGQHTKTLQSVRAGQLAPAPDQHTDPPFIIPEDVSCPHPYTKVGLGCFTVHSTVRMTWSQAREECQNLDGDLANPYDIYDLVLFLDETFAGRWGFWVGGRLEDSGTWTWVSGVPMETQVDFWGRGEPGDDDEEERCVFLHSLWRFRAGSDQCEDKKYFICERKLDF